MLFRVRLHVFCLAAALCAASPALRAQPGAPTVDPLGSHVRGTTPALNALIAGGAQRSPTFRDLVEQLNASDVVVYLETVHLPASLDGRLVFLTTAGGVRYLHAQVTTGLSFEEFVAVAGHELQHAVEVALHPEVRDRDAMRTLYKRIGVPSGIPDRYDTIAAQTTGRRVRAEMS